MTIVVISKDEPALAETLDRLERQIVSIVPALVGGVEVVVVDASSGRLDEIRTARPWVRWIDFTQPPGVRVTIPHQRNRGVVEARGDIIVFTDCGCIPGDDWLATLLKPILVNEEQMVSGHAGATGAVDPYHVLRQKPQTERYLAECSTINLAVCRVVFDQVGDFDESFEYGSDTDFSWRAVGAGIRIRYVPEAVILHDWGTRRRQVKRSYAYGKARARLFYKHVISTSRQSTGKRSLNERDVVAIAYPAFLIGLPILIRHRAYLLLLLIPLWRNRRNGPLQAVLDHVVLGAGVLAGVAELVRRPAR